MLEVSKGSPTHTRAVEEADRGRFDDTDVESLAVLPENSQTKKKNKVMMQVNKRMK